MALPQLAAPDAGPAGPNPALPKATTAPKPLTPLAPAPGQAPSIGSPATTAPMIDPVPPMAQPVVQGPAAGGVTASSLGPTAPTNGSAATPAPTVAHAAALPAGYNRDVNGVVSYNNFGGAGAAPLTAPTAQKYWDNTSQSYKDSTINPTQTTAGSVANAAGQNDSSYMAPYLDAQGQYIDPKTGLTTTGAQPSGTAANGGGPVNMAGQPIAPGSETGPGGGPVTSAAAMNYMNPDGSHAANAQAEVAASAALPPRTLQNGVLQQGGVTLGVNNNTGSLVDPTTGALLNNQYATPGQTNLGPANGGLSPSSLAALGALPASASNPYGAGSAVSVANGTNPAPATATAGGSTGNAGLDQLLAGMGSGAGTVNTSPLDPSNSLLNQVISPGALTNPVDLANAAWKTFQQQTNPQYQADLRDANRMAAAGGALGSGTLNTSLGDIANQRQNTLQSAQQQLMESALGQANQNAYQNVGIAQQQQGFQNQQQQEAVNNSLQELLAGNQNNPANMSLLLSSIFGNQAGQAGSSLGQLISGTTAANAQANNPLMQLLQQYMTGVEAGAPARASTSTAGSLLNLPMPQPSVIGGG